MERLFLYYDLIELKLIACFVTLEIVKLLRRPMIIYSTIVLFIVQNCVKNNEIDRTEINNVLTIKRSDCNKN